MLDNIKRTKVASAESELCSTMQNQERRLCTSITFGSWRWKLAAGLLLLRPQAHEDCCCCCCLRKLLLLNFLARVSGVIWLPLCLAKCQKGHMATLLV